MMALVGDREERRRAAREAVLQARLEAQRPWWQRRFLAWLTAAPRRLWRGLKWWGVELAEVLLWWAALALVLVVGLLIWWAWQTVF